jgi:hypothetical protein
MWTYYAIAIAFFLYLALFQTVREARALYIKCKDTPRRLYNYYIHTPENTFWMGGVEFAESTVQFACHLLRLIRCILSSTVNLAKNFGGMLCCIGEQCTSLVLIFWSIVVAPFILVGTIVCILLAIPPLVFGLLYAGCWATKDTFVPLTPSHYRRPKTTPLETPGHPEI